jgi:hypothetical protein
MKNLAEKKLLVSMMQALGQPVDPALIESIRLEEELTAKLFPQQQVMVEEIEEEVVEVQPEVLIEASPPQPPSPFPIDPEPPTAKDLVAKSAEAITKLKPSTQTSSKPTLQETELQYIRRQLEDIQKRYSTLAWGSGGGGSVLIRDMSDFVNSSVGVGKYMTWNNGMFYMDDINTNEVTYNTTLVTTATYTAQSGDYYIGVNYAGPVTITLPTIALSGRNLIIKDESGNCENNAITITGTTIDNDAGGVILQINNGAIDLIFRDGWRII